MFDVAPVAGAAVLALAVAVALFAWTLLTRPRGDKRTLTNLHRGLYDGEPRPEVTPESTPRLLGVARRLTPAGRVRALQSLWLRAGRPPAWPVDRLIVVKVVLPTVTAALGVLYLSSRATPLTLLVGVAVPVVSYFLPELLLHSRAQERSQKISLELADTLDQMTIAVEAGLGFDAAMAKAGHNGTGPLAEELVRTLQDISLGHSRREAYESLASRTDVVDLRRFVRAVVQADRYGVAVAEVLRTQAAEMRMKRRQRAEEKAMQIPVKVIFPLMLCILPVLFIVMLGPAAINVIHTLSS